MFVNCQLSLNGLVHEFIQYKTTNCKSLQDPSETFLSLQKIGTMKKKNKAIALSYPQHHHQQNHTLLFFFFFFCILVCYLPRSIGRLEEKDAAPVGHGYKIRSVFIDPSGKSLTAYLGLINSSSIFGPDIQNLNFIARYACSYAIALCAFLQESAHHICIHIITVNSFGSYQCCGAT